jgi:F-type H+-transporting ATPase subunit b
MEINATILVSAVSFIVFIFIMNTILYEPVLKIMEQRADYIKNNKDKASDFEKNAQNLIVDKNEKIADAQRTSRDIVASKAESLKQEKAKVLDDTKNSVNSYFQEQKQNLAGQKDEAAVQMKSDVADLANNLTTKLMGNSVAFDTLNEQEIEEVMRKNA